jgi:uncharacterized protein (TIGR00290 family)
MEPILFSWSSGKDSALALHEVLGSGSYTVAALLTTVTADYDRVSMHGVRRELLEAQASALRLPLEKIWIRPNASNQDYEDQMRAALERYQAGGVNAVAFGDLYLQDVRQYRETQLAQVGMRALFPLWARDTRELFHHLLRSGFKAVVTCVDTQALPAEFCGREIDETFLADLPAGIDPCGENGEFHSFAYAGPIFSRPIAFTRGERVLREGRFQYIDLLPEE